MQTWLINLTNLELWEWVGVGFWIFFTRFVFKQKVHIMSVCPHNDSSCVPSNSPFTQPADSFLTWVSCEGKRNQTKRSSINYHRETLDGLKPVNLRLPVL